ncbi:MAG: CoA pyrophosphatase [Betaproteobacteria bacterium]|nr:CoA pyrophosphatase [Betaproteobacteria bacterium]MDE2622166.1 CoA pyrophosphatase [Betaproteobacteria bacterium]
MMSEDACAAAKPAAVLVPLVARPEGLQVLLTRRTEHLSDHAGQISFPGGRVEPDDASAAATALRETEEEIGLSRQRVELLGALREYFIPTGYRVVPVVGWVSPPFTLEPDPSEVAEVFEVPLEYFFDPERHVLQQDVRNGRLRQYYAIPWQQHNIWGATAGILVNFYQVLANGAAA